MKNTLININLHRFKDRQFVAFFEEILSILGKNTIKDIPERFLGALQTTNTQLQEAYKKETTILATAKIMALDQKRDAVLSSLRLLLQSKRVNPFTGEQLEMVFKVEEVIQRYGGGKISEFDLNGETAALNNLINDLNKEGAKEITALGLSEHLSQLKTTNDDFAKAYQERALTQAQNAAIGGLKEARGKILICYRGLEGYINTSAKIPGEHQAAYLDLLGFMNEIIKKYNLLLHAKPKKGGNLGDIDESAQILLY